MSATTLTRGSVDGAAEAQAAATDSAAPAAAVAPVHLSTGASRLGVWSAILTGVFSVGWAISYFGIQQVIAPMPPWRGAAAYAAEFTPIHLLNLYPSLPLAVTFVVLMACIHVYAPAEKKVWSLSALAIAVLYATMASINYNIQLVAVRQSLLAGETEGLAMITMANPHSVFVALANSYVYMCLAMLFAAPVFEGGTLARWTRWLLLAAGLFAPFQLAWSLFDLSPLVIALPFPLWLVGTPAACALLAVLFQRAGHAPAPTRQVAPSEA